MTSARVLLLAEAGDGVGFGHLSRASALAAACRTLGATATLLVRGAGIPAASLRDAAAHEQDWLDPAFAGAEELRAATHLAVDSYRPDRAHLEALSAGRPALFFDDDARLDYPPGLVVNGAPGARAAGRAPVPGVTHLSGPRYLALRRPFIDAAARHGIRPTVRRLLLSVGGFDGRGLLPALARALAEALPGVDLEVVGGAAPPGALPAACRIHAGLTAEALASLMAGCDLAVAASGQTLLELARVGVPAVAVTTAANQTANARGLRAAGAILHAGDHADPALPAAVAARCHDLLPAPRRAALAASARALLAGDGARALAEMLLPDLPLRFVDLRDCPEELRARVRDWRNADAVRAAMVHRRPIPAEAHARFLASLDAPGCDRRFWVVFLDGAPAATANLQRMDFASGVTEWGFYIGEPAFLGKGWGKRILRELLRRIFTDFGFHTVNTQVLPENAAAAALYRSLGFRDAGTATVDGDGETLTVLRMMYTRKEWENRNE